MFAVVSTSFIPSASTIPLLVVSTLASYGFFVVLWRYTFGSNYSYVDPGLIFQTVLLVYTVYPLVTLYIYDFRFGYSADNRLNHIALNDDLIEIVWLCSQFAMAGFGGAYLAFRNPRQPDVGAQNDGAAPALWIGLAASATILALLFWMRGGGSYLEEYRFMQGLPVWVVQGLNIVSALFPASLFGLMALYMRNRRALALSIALGSVMFFVITSAARAPIVLCAMGLLIAYDHFGTKNKIPPVTLAAGAVLGIAAFLVLGFLRDDSAILADAAGRTEFIAVFVTALDIQQLYITGSTLDMNANLLLSDLMRLIPQQFLTFEKVDPASWYVNTFYPYYADAGGGLAFGMVSESLLGGGPWIALVRGFALGSVLSLALYLLTRRPSLWRTIIYMWLVALLYHSFRDTTFTLLGRFAFQFGPAVLLLFILSKLLAARRVAAPVITKLA